MPSESENLLSISLDPVLSAFVREQASSAGFATPADYVSHLLHSAKRLLEEQRLEEALREGLNSGDAGPMESRDWDELRERARLASKR